MREIIFRFWDKKSKKYRNVDSIVFNGNNLYKGDSLPNVVNSWGEDIIEQKDILIHRERGEYILEQYTGIKDKNGTMVFEGDIIKGVSFAFPCPETLELPVYYDEQFATFQMNYFDLETIEVVGNIHKKKEK